MNTISDYNNGGDGIILWVEDNVNRWDRQTLTWVPVKLIQMQKDNFRECLEMKETRYGKRFKYRFIFFSRPRGDFKTFDVMLILLWRLFNFPNENIVIGSNSRDQSKFLLLGDMNKTILNSPKLLKIVGRENVLEKGIFIKNNKGDILSSITTMSGEASIKSGMTCAGFTEMYKMKDPALYTDLSGSIRTTPNGMIIGESIVSTKSHLFYRLYKIFKEGKDKLMFFQHYDSIHYNPYMTEEELNSYKHQFLPHEYEQNFVNTWASARSGLFTEKLIKQMLTDDYTLPANKDTLKKLESKYGITEWIITGGLDRAKPFNDEATLPIKAMKKRSRTVWTLTGKGLIGDTGKYLYFMLDFKIIPKGSEKIIKQTIDEASIEFEYLDNITLEDFETNSIRIHCENQDIPAEMVTPTYNNQRKCFLPLYHLIENGLYKKPKIPFYIMDGEVIPGINNELDILEEELSIFSHDTDRSWFGSPEKKQTLGIKDDSVYSFAWSVHASSEIFNGALREVFDQTCFHIPANPENSANNNNIVSYE